MPFTLPPVAPHPYAPGRAGTPRRRFLGGALAAAAACAFGPLSPLLRAADLPAPHQPADPHRFALLSDIHVAADPGQIGHGVNMFDNLKRVCAEVLAAPTPPGRRLH